MQSDTADTSDSLTGKAPDTLLELSSDLKFIFEKQINCDLTLYVGDRTIKCHKAILSARSKWFAFRINESHADGTSSIILTENEQILDAILVYIYTGNLRLIESLQVPVLDLREAATMYGLDRFNKLLTKMIKCGEKPGSKKSHKFLWKCSIRSCKSSGSKCVLEDFSLDGTDRWHLKMRPLCFSPAKYAFWIYVVRESTNAIGNIIHVVNLEMHIIDACGKIRTSFVSDHIFKKDGESKMSEHIALCKLLKHPNICLPRGILTLSGQVTIYPEDSTAQRMTFQTGGPHEKGITNELHALSYDMYKMLKSGLYTDIGVLTKGSASHKIHSYILYARSMIPVTHISFLMELNCFGSIAWRSFIHFLYTGQGRYLEDHMREVYSAVSRLQLLEAKRKYSDLLANNVTVGNAFDILSEATIHNDTELGFSVLYFIAHNDIIDHPMWIEFASKYPTWTRQLMLKTGYKKS